MTVHFPLDRPSTPLASKVVDFREEPYSHELMLEMVPLWKEHYDEVELYKEIPLSPNLPVYKNSAASQMLKIFTLRLEGILLGYEFFFIHKHSHFSMTTVAIQDLLFLTRQARKGTLGYRFMKWVDENLKEAGVDLVFRYANKKHDYGILLDRMGYVEHDIVYSKRFAQ